MDQKQVSVNTPSEEIGTSIKHIAFLIEAVIGLRWAFSKLPICGRPDTYVVSSTQRSGLLLRG